MTESETGRDLRDGRDVALRRRRLVATTHTVLGLVSSTVIAIAWMRALHPRQPFAFQIGRYGGSGALLIGVWPYLGSWLYVVKSARFADGPSFVYLASFVVVSVAASAIGVYLVSNGFSLWIIGPVSLIEYLAFRATAYSLFSA